MLFPKNSIAKALVWRFKILLSLAFGLKLDYICKGFLRSPPAEATRRYGFDLRSNKRLHALGFRV